MGGVFSPAGDTGGGGGCSAGARHQAAGVHDGSLGKAYDR